MQIQLQDYFLNFLSLALSFSMLHICNNFGVTKVSLKSVEGVIREKKKKSLYLLAHCCCAKALSSPLQLSLIIGKNFNIPM